MVQTPSGPVRQNDAVAQMLNDGMQTPQPSYDSGAESAVDIENLTIGQVIRNEEPNTQSLYDDSHHDFPITVNSRVEGWIDYFTGKGRPHMDRYLGRSSRYLPTMKEIFKKYGLPEDLVYLALIESGFNLRAKSHAKAVGPWQFMKATGKRYGLKVDAWLDERRDPIRATEAAANYLKDLYLMFESWYLAASAYNAGEYKILRAIEELKTNNYWRISQTRLIRRETKDYIPKLIAAAIIAKNPEKYGFGDVVYQDPLEFETLTVDFPVRIKDIAASIDVSEDEMLDLNPAYIKHITPPGGVTYEIRVPPNHKTLVARKIASLRASPSLNVPRKTYSPLAAGKPSDDFVTHTVRRGESLWTIAERYDVTVQNLFKWNGLRKSQIHPGRKLRIKSNADS